MNLGTPGSNRRRRKKPDVHSEQRSNKSYALWQAAGPECSEQLFFWLLARIYAEFGNPLMLELCLIYHYYLPTLGVVEKGSM